MTVVKGFESVAVTENWCVPRTLVSIAAPTGRVPVQLGVPVAAAHV